MTTIITPDLVRRYLRAKAWTLDGDGDGWWIGTNELGEEGCGFPDAWIERAPIDADVFTRVTGSQIGAMRLCVRLGMLAAAEMVRPPADRSEIDAFVVGSRLALMLDLIAAAGVDPEAWEAAR